MGPTLAKLGDGARAAEKEVQVLKSATILLPLQSARKDRFLRSKENLPSKAPIMSGPPAQAVPIQELDKHIVAHDPFVVFAQVGEELLGLRVLGLVIEQGIGRFAHHVGLPGEDEYLHRLVASMHRRGNEETPRHTENDYGTISFS